MPRRLPSLRVPRAAVLVTVLAAAAILLGALLWFRPYVTKKQVSDVIDSVPLVIAPLPFMAMPLMATELDSSEAAG